VRQRAARQRVAQGRADLSHPDASTWTAAEALSPIAWLTGKPIRLPPS